MIGTPHMFTLYQEPPHNIDTLLVAHIKFLFHITCHTFESISEGILSTIQFSCIIVLRRPHGAKPLRAFLTGKCKQNLSPKPHFSNPINLTKILVSQPYFGIDIFDKWFSFFIFLKICLEN